MTEGKTNEESVNSGWRILKSVSVPFGRGLSTPTEYKIVVYEGKLTGEEHIDHPKQLFLLVAPKDLPIEDLNYGCEGFGISKDSAITDGVTPTLDRLWEQFYHEESEYNELPGENQKLAYKAWQSMTPDEKKWHRFGHFFDQSELSSTLWRSEARKKT